MSRISRTRTLLSAFVVAALVSVLAPNVARADATCTTMLTAKYNYLIAHGGYWRYELVKSTDGSPGDVTYARGAFTYILGSPYYLWDSRNGNYTFSDRYDGYSNGQNFSVNGAESLQIYLSEGGALYLYNNTYSYYILNNADMSCVGNTVTKYVSGSVYTISIRDWSSTYP
jgi:hypothetical protein